MKLPDIGYRKSTTRSASYLLERLQWREVAMVHPVARIDNRLASS